MCKFIRYGAVCGIICAALGCDSKTAGTAGGTATPSTSLPAGTATYLNTVVPSGFVNTQTGMVGIVSIMNTVQANIAANQPLHGFLVPNTAYSAKSFLSTEGDFDFTQCDTIFATMDSTITAGFAQVSKQLSGMQSEDTALASLKSLTDTEFTSGTKAESESFHYLLSKKDDKYQTNGTFTGGANENMAFIRTIAEIKFSDTTLKSSGEGTADFALSVDKANSTMRLGGGIIYTATDAQNSSTKANIAALLEIAGGTAPAILFEAQGSASDAKMAINQAQGSIKFSLKKVGAQMLNLVVNVNGSEASKGSQNVTLNANITVVDQRCKVTINECNSAIADFCTKIAQ